MEYRYADSEATPWADMFPTSVLNDGSAGDTATGETTGETVWQTDDPYCQSVEAVAVIVAAVSLDTAHSITSLRFVGNLTAQEEPGDPCIIPIEEPPPPQTPGTASWAVETSTDGATWAEVDTGALSAPDLTGVGTSDSEGFDETVAVGQTVCWVRVIIENRQNSVGGNGNVQSGIYLSDFRITGTDTEEPCEDPDPEPEPEPGEGDCTCSWTEATPSTDGFTETAPVSTTHTEAAPLTSSFTRRTCP